MSSCAGGTSTSACGRDRPVGAGRAAAVASSRRRRGDSLRSWSVRRRDATVISQPAGSRARPPPATASTAASSASCTASSQASKSSVAADERAEDLRRQLAQQVLDARARSHLLAAAAHERPDLDRPVSGRPGSGPRSRPTRSGVVAVDDE